MVFIFYFLTLLLLHTIEAHYKEQKHPHIIFIIADDLGWNDVSFHGSPQIPTPNIDALASSGIILNNYYTQHLCTPSRGCLMTGQYPIRYGLQHYVLKVGEASALPLDLKILPEHLRDLGYATHSVGKIIYGLDLHNGTDIVKGYEGRYATKLFTEKAIDIIENHNLSQALFLYLSYTAPHVGNEYMPLQAPSSYIRKFDYIKDPSRRKLAAMISALDDSIGEVSNALWQRGMLGNSIIVFASDNGGDISAGRGATSSNYPLRGGKFNWWEGGIRVAAFLWSPLLKLEEPRVSMQLMHATDWLPTLYSAIGGDLSDLGDIDGKNMWNSFLHDLPSPRQEILHNIDPIENTTALRVGDFKIVMGNFTTDPDEMWSRTTGYEDDVNWPSHLDDWVYRSGMVKDILVKMKWYLPKESDVWRESAKIHCNKPEVFQECRAFFKPCLFNITADPCEMNNIADFHPEIIQHMLELISFYKSVAVKPQSKQLDYFLADPRCHDFAIVPWLDSEHFTNCVFRQTDRKHSPKKCPKFPYDGM